MLPIANIHTPIFRILINHILIDALKPATEKYRATGNNCKFTQ